METIALSDSDDSRGAFDTPAYVPPASAGPDDMHPNRDADSPAYDPDSPAYTPVSRAYNPTSPAYNPTSPAYDPESPLYGPASVSPGDAVAPNPSDAAHAGAAAAAAPRVRRPAPPRVAMSHEGAEELGMYAPRPFSRKRPRAFDLQAMIEEQRKRSVRARVLCGVAHEERRRVHHIEQRLAEAEGALKEASFLAHEGRNAALLILSKERPELAAILPTQSELQRRAGEAKTFVDNLKGSRNALDANEEAARVLARDLLPLEPAGFCIESAAVRVGQLESMERCSSCSAGAGPRLTCSTGTSHTLCAECWADEPGDALVHKSSEKSFGCGCAGGSLTRSAVVDAAPWAVACEIAKQGGSACAICLDPHTAPKAGKCGHVFCGGCIDTWRAKSARCPRCKGLLGKLRDVYL